MNKLVIASFIVAGFVSFGFSQKVSDGASVTKEGHEIFAVLAKWADANKSGDVKALNEIYSEELIITAFDDSMRGKKEETSYLRPGDPSNPLVKFEDVRVKLIGNAAAVVGLQRVQFKLFHPTAGEQVSNIAFRFTAVFAKEDGRWQLVVLHLGKGK